MTSRLTKLNSAYKILTAKLAGGDYFWNIYQPNYNQVDGSLGTPTYSGRKFHVEPTKNNKTTQDPLYDALSWIVCGDPSTITPGSVLQCTNSNDFPTLTVTQVPEQHEFEAVRTPKIGQILDSGNQVYSNIYFEYGVSIFPGNPEFPQALPSLSVPNKVAVCYIRPSVYEKMVFQDLTPGQGSNDQWFIQLVEYRTNIMLLHLGKEDRT